jgi:hypothetical protein
MHRMDAWTGLWGARYVFFTLEGSKGCDDSLEHYTLWENGPFGGLLT